MVTTEGVLTDAFNDADIKLELIPASGPRKFDFDMHMGGMVEIVPLEKLEPMKTDVKLEIVELEQSPLEEAPSSPKLLGTLSKWNKIAKGTHHHCLFVSRFLQNLPADFEIFEKQRATLAFITFGFIKELCNFENFDGWNHEKSLEYVELRRRLALIATKLLLALSPSGRVSDPNILRNAIASIISPDTIVCPHEKFFRTGQESKEELEEMEHQLILMNSQEKLLAQFISGKIEIYPERLLFVLRLETSIENLGSKLFRTDILEVLEDYLREIREVDLPYFATQYRITALQSSNRKLCALLVLLLPFITRSYQQWKYHERNPGSKWFSPLWTKNVLKTFFKVQSFIEVCLDSEIFSSLNKVLSSCGLNFRNFIHRIRFQQSVEQFNNRAFSLFVGSRLLSSKSTNMCPLILCLGFEESNSDLKSENAVNKILHSTNNPEILYASIKLLLDRKPGIFSREFDDDRISAQIDSIFFVLLKKWINKRDGVRLVICWQRFIQNADSSVLANMFLLSRLKLGRAIKGLQLIEEILKCLHGWQLNKLHCTKEKSAFLRRAKIPGQSYYCKKRGLSTRNPFSYPLIADVIVKSHKFPRNLYSLIQQGDWSKFIPDLINYALQKGVPSKPLFHRLLQISKPHCREVHEASTNNSSYIYELVTALLKSQKTDETLL